MARAERGGRVNALVLAGGAARGAYEVGVVDYILHDVARAIGKTPDLDILCGRAAERHHRRSPADELLHSAADAVVEILQ